MSDTTDKERERIDKRPSGNKQQASQQASGEVFSEYGVVDLNTSFPAESKRWRSEYGPDEDHVVVPFRVVRRGLKTRRGARSVAERMEEEEGGSYRAVLLSDMRGI